MVGSECPGSSGGKRVAFLNVGELHAQLVGCSDSSDGKSLVWFSREPGFDSWSQSLIFPHILIKFTFCIPLIGRIWIQI